MTKKPGGNTAIFAYLTMVGCLIAISMNLEPKNGFARFHIRQGFGMHLVYHAMAFVFSGSDFYVAWQLWTLLYVVALVFGVWTAAKNKQTALPLLGGFFQKWFTFIQ